LLRICQRQVRHFFEM